MKRLEDEAPENFFFFPDNFFDDFWSAPSSSRSLIRALCAEGNQRRMRNYFIKKKWRKFGLGPFGLNFLGNKQEVVLFRFRERGR